MGYALTIEGLISGGDALYQPIHHITLGHAHEHICLTLLTHYQAKKF